MKKLIPLLLLLAVTSNAQVIGDTMTLSAGPPSGAQGIAASTVGTPGNVPLYYYVATVYPGGLILPGQPVTVGNSVGIANLDGTNYVQIGWSSAPLASSYYVIRGTSPGFLTSGACTSCVVVAATTATGFSDQGGATTNWPPAGVATESASRFSVTLDNVSESAPFLHTLLDGASGRIPIETDASGLLQVQSGIQAADGAYLTSTSTDGQYQWRTGSSIFIGASGGGYLDWSARTGAVDGFATRVSNDFSVVTSFQGSDVRVQAIGGNTSPGSLMMAHQGVATVAAGTTSVGEAYGGNFITLDQAGGGVNRFGAVGNLVFSGATTGGSLFNFGLYGEYHDGATSAITDPGTNFTAGVVGVINNTAAADRANDAAIMAYLTSGNPTAAFMVVDNNNTAGVAYNYGLDLMGTTGLNAYAVADVRGEQGDRINNGSAGLWGITRGSGNFTGFNIESSAFANLGTPANGTVAYCSDCDPVSGTIAGCTSAGAQSGAVAIRVAGNWDCLSQ